MNKITRRSFLELTAAGIAAATALGEQTTAIGANMDQGGNIPSRELGKTGEKVSILAFGGFHLIEALPADAERMLNYYLDSGGNFIETATSYGDSEEKVGRVMKHRRKDCFLSTKAHQRSKKECAESIDRSLKLLQTDHVDNLFLHNIGTQEDLDAVLAPDGALAAAEEARKAGKIRFISVTGHNPEMLLKTLESYPFDAVMEWMNYYDRFSFPLIYDRIIPYCLEKGIGLIAMKPLGDGLLYRSVEQAMRWTWSLPIASAASGNNTMEMLEKNIELAKSFRPMSEQEKLDLYATAPEYMRYVCRRCEKCGISDSAGLDIKAIFELEGYFDRQMYTGSVPDPGEYALRERLKHWFGNEAVARDRYSKLEPKVPKDLTPDQIKGRCLYGIDVHRKLRLAAWKLTNDKTYLEGMA